jgi:hypothetical protein
MRWLEASGHGNFPQGVKHGQDRRAARAPARRAALLFSKHIEPVGDEENPVIPYEVPRIARENAVADGKCSLVSIKIATHAEISFAQ